MAALSRTRSPRLSVLLLPLSLLGACSGGDAEPASRAPTEDARTRSDAPGSAGTTAEQPLVVFLGDSITAGLHLDAEDAFPAVLQREAEEAGLPFRLVNAGVSGDTTAGGLRRVDWLLRQEPDLVVVELGGNDGLRGVAVDAIEENLRAIVEKLTAGGARVLFLGMRLPPNYGPDYTGAFEALYDRVAEETDVAYVPFFMEGVGGVARLNMADGLHPTAAGHERLARTVWPALRDVLEALAAD
jgi:acyl-CoA thioesterase-1